MIVKIGQSSKNSNQLQHQLDVENAVLGYKCLAYSYLDNEVIIICHSALIQMWQMEIYISMNS